MQHFAAMILLAAALVPCREAAAQVRWTTMDRAQEAARAANTPILIEFWATWCAGCQEMDRDVYTDERVGVAMTRLQPVKIDVDRERGMARKYAIDGTPTLVLTDAFGRELFRHLGALSRERLLGLLDALPADITTINQLSLRIAADRRDFAALEAMGGELRTAGFYRTSSEYYARALKAPGARTVPGARPRILLCLGRNALDLQRPLEARKYLDEIMSRHPGTAEAADAQRLRPRG